MLKTAKVVKKSGKVKAPKVTGAGSILSYAINVAPPPSIEPYDELIEAGKKTHGFPLFKLSYLEEFKQWLMTVEGKLRSEVTSREICVDISKCLR